MLALATGCELEVTRGPDWLVIAVRNLARDADPSHLADELWTLLERHLAHRLVLRLDEVSHVDERLMAELADLYQRITARGGVMRLCGLSQRNRRALHRYGLDEQFASYVTWEEAVRGSNAPRQPR